MGRGGSVLGIDVGTARIGVAVSDPDRRVAVPVATVAAGAPADLEAIAVIAEEHDVNEIVVGLPLRMDGGRGRAAEAAETFGARLGERLGLPVRFEDERLSTVEADRALAATGAGGRERRTSVDRSAAAVILQSYLDRRSRAATYP
jgi:putative Holliday junction resolvase